MRIQREGIEETRLTRSSKLSKLDDGYSRFITLFFLLLRMFEVLYNKKDVWQWNWLSHRVMNSMPLDSVF